MTLGELRAQTAHLPDETPIGYADPNFGTLYHEPLELSSVRLPNPKTPFYGAYSKTHILIDFPFETPCD